MKVKELLNVSVFPIIEKLVNHVIPSKFILEELSFKSHVYSGRDAIHVNASSLNESLKIVNNEYNYHDSLNLDFFINIEFNANKSEHQTMKYGCQIRVLIGSETIQDVESENEYSIWYLYCGNQKTLIDIVFTIEQELNIIAYFINYLQQSEEDILI